VPPGRAIRREVQIRLVEIYQRLLSHYGPQGWWPGDGAFEIAVGAILTQNTSWKNAEAAILRLKEAGVLSPLRMRQLPMAELAELVRPSGYYRVKAERMHRFLSFLEERYRLDLEAMLSRPLKQIREELLAVKGIGPETADSILLYAGGHPIFVVDAYTKRIFARHGLVREGCSYSELQDLAMGSLPREAGLFNEYHALLVRLGKERCRRTPRCSGCVLQYLLDRPAGG
jgi:endonuclease-3 related protein